jgi:hypothetical protein
LLITSGFSKASGFFDITPQQAYRGEQQTNQTNYHINDPSHV